VKWKEQLGKPGYGEYSKPGQKDPLCGVFFFLTGLWPVLPLGQCSPSKSAALHPTCLHKSLALLPLGQCLPAQHNMYNTRAQQQLIMK